jgi:hypothetical protein
MLAWIIEIQNEYVNLVYHLQRLFFQKGNFISKDLPSLKTCSNASGH